MVARNETSRMISANKVEGTPVYNLQGEKLGEIKDVMIGKLDGKVSYAVMSFGGFMGIGNEYYPMPWDKLDYEESQGGYVVNMSKEQLENAPRYEANREPDWNDPSFGREVSNYYGTTYPY